MSRSTHAVAALFATFLLLALPRAAAAGAPIIDPRLDAVQLALPPAAAGGAAGAFVNPAAWSAANRASSAFWWTDPAGRDGIGDWGFSWGRRIGLSVRRRSLLGDGRGPAAFDWQIGLARGRDGRHTALAYRWSRGAADARREPALVVGHILRPGRAFALGLTGFESLASGDRAARAAVAVRPLGSPLLTLAGDFAMRGSQSWRGGAAGLAVAVQPVSGLRLGVSAREEGGGDWRASWSVGVTTGVSGMTVLPAYDAGGDLAGTTWLLETDPPRAPLPERLIPRLESGPDRIAAVNLEHKVLTYRKYRWFDDERVAWLDLMQTLDAVRDDPRYTGVALNLAGATGRPSVFWELREKLAEIRARGKEVIVHIDRAGMLLYPTAAVADRLTIDPQGGLMLPGFDLSRTYMADLLDKMGLGFEALQYFDHKTAVEVLSRRDMSPADREQRGRIVQVLYEWARSRTVAGRGLSPEDFDRVIDDEVMISAQRAEELGLVDAAARWSDLGSWLGKERRAILVAPPGPPELAPDERWGAPPVVAVVYAVGACAMDSGIKGRETSAALRAMAHDPRVRAVVLRADSPGGDPLPSDLVAGAIRTLRKAGKPVVVSQGDVAASGGYWISMDGTEILTTPLTITGSVGVISGWVWDKTLHEKIGVNADGVSEGRHADLFRNVRYPIGVDVPARALTAEESSMAKDRVLEMYDGFVTAVAKGRGLEEERVREIGGGRVWMGADAIARGLCDSIGGLGDAIARARELAGLDPDVPVELREYPPRPLIELPKLRMPLPGVAVALPLATVLGKGGPAEPPPRDAGLEFLRRVVAADGAPQVLLPPDELPDAWRDAP